jgi:hypothetical protein
VFQNKVPTSHLCDFITHTKEKILSSSSSSSHKIKKNSRERRMENITNEIDGNKDDDTKWLGVPVEDIPIGKRRRLSRQLSSLSSNGGMHDDNGEVGGNFLSSLSPKNQRPSTTTTSNNNNKNNNVPVLKNGDDKVDRFINIKRGFKECLHVESLPAKR